MKVIGMIYLTLTNYDQYIDTNVEKAMGYVQKTPMTEKAKKRRNVRNESLIRTYIKPKAPSTNEGFTLASNIKKNE